MHKDSQTIIAELTEIAQNGLPGQTLDARLITRIDALNRLCDIYEEENISTAPLQSQRTALYPQLIEAIESRDIADSAPLVQALYRLIYGNALVDDAPRQWVDTLIALANRYLEMCEQTATDAPSDYLTMLAYSIIGASQEQYAAADRQSNQLLDTLVNSDLAAMSLSHKIELLYARITTAGTFSFHTSTAPRWADLAATLAEALTPLHPAEGTPSPLSTLSDTALLRWHTTLTLLPPFRLLPTTTLTRALSATHAYFVNHDFVS